MSGVNDHAALDGDIRATRCAVHKHPSGIRHINGEGFETSQHVSLVRAPKNGALGLAVVDAMDGNVGFISVSPLA